MKVIVAIITRNRAQQLKRCLNSLIIQSIKPHQVLVVDNNSIDSTHETIISFKKKLPIKYIFENKPGAPHARNTVLRLIKGDIMATIDDDCEAFPNWIEKIIAAHNKFPEVVALQGWSISQPKNGAISIIAQFIQESGFKENIVAKKDPLYYLNINFLKKSTAILLLDAKNASFKIKTLKKLGLSFNVGWNHGDDLEFSKQLLARGEEIIFNPEIRVFHWERPTLSQFLKQRFGAGAEVKNAQYYWPKFFPKRRFYWWVGRVIQFIFFVVRNKYYRKLFSLIPLFIVERSVCMLGRYKEGRRLRLAKLF